MRIAEQERLDLAGEDDHAFLVVDLADGVVAASAKCRPGDSRGLAARVRGDAGRHGQAGGDQNGQFHFMPFFHCGRRGFSVRRRRILAREAMQGRQLTIIVRPSGRILKIV